MEEKLILTGFLLIFFGFLLIFLGAVLSSKNLKTEWGFFGLIGPIPFGVWSDKRAFILTITIFAIMLTIFILLKKW
ncbi:MAG: hypothetical protein QW423_01840 [Candidatus Aenigmatarchaeota archaeon]